MEVSANELQVHDLIKRQQPVFTPGGKVEERYVITYFIGHHGPFTRQYPVDGYSEEKVRGDITQHVSSLRNLLTSV